MVYDISARITNALPSLKVTEDLVVTINNRHKNIMAIRALEDENERKNEEDKASEFEIIRKSLELLVGKEKAKIIEELDLPFNEYKELRTAIMEIAITGSLSSEDKPR